VADHSSRPRGSRSPRSPHRAVCGPRREQDITLVEADDRGDNLDAARPLAPQRTRRRRPVLVATHHRGRDPFGRPWEPVPVEAAEQDSLHQPCDLVGYDVTGGVQGEPGDIDGHARNLRATGSARSARDANARAAPPLAAGSQPRSLSHWAQHQNARHGTALGCVGAGMNQLTRVSGAPRPVREVRSCRSRSR